MISQKLVIDWFHNKIIVENNEFLSELEVFAYELASEHGRPYSDYVATYKVMIWQILFTNKLIVINI